MTIYYVYSHIKPGQKVPFYIGKGKDNRAFSTQGLVAYLNGYRVNKTTLKWVS